MSKEHTCLCAHHGRPKASSTCAILLLSLCVGCHWRDPMRMPPQEGHAGLPRGSLAVMVLAVVNIREQNVYFLYCEQPSRLIHA